MTSLRKKGLLIACLLLASGCWSTPTNPDQESQRRKDLLLRIATKGAVAAYLWAPDADRAQKVITVARQARSIAGMGSGSVDLRSLADQLLSQVEPDNRAAAVFATESIIDALQLALGTELEVIPPIQSPEARRLLIIASEEAERIATILAQR